MAKQTDASLGWQPIEVPVTDQTALPGFRPIEVTPTTAPEPAAPDTTPPAATPPAAKTSSKEN
jgi:hypothetical protein